MRGLIRDQSDRWLHLNKLYSRLRLIVTFSCFLIAISTIDRGNWMAWQLLVADQVIMSYSLVPLGLLMIFNLKPSQTLGEVRGIFENRSFCLLLCKVSFCHCTSFWKLHCVAVTQSTRVCCLFTYTFVLILNFGSCLALWSSPSWYPHHSNSRRSAVIATIRITKPHII